MRCEFAVDIDSCPDHVWAVLTDMTCWPRWTGAVREVTLSGGGAVGCGSVVRLRAARLPERTWRVEECHRRGGTRLVFALRSEGVGGRAVLRFRLAAVEPDPARPGREPTTRLTVEHERTGWVGGTVARLTARTVRGHLRSLIDDLAHHCASRRAACAAADVAAASHATPGGRDGEAVAG